MEILKSLSQNDVEEFPYIESLTREQLKEIEGKSVLIDSGRRDIFYCMKETSTSINRKLVFRFTKSQINKKSRQLRYLRNKLKPESIKLAELQLFRFPFATLDSEQFVQYLEARRHVREQLKNYYSNETLEETIVYQPDPLDFIVEKSGDIYYGKHLLFITRLRGVPPGIANLDAHICYLTLILSNKHLTQGSTNQNTENLNRIIEDTTIWMNKERPSEELVVKLIQVKQQTHLIISRLLVLPFRRLKFVSKIYYDKCDLKLVKDLRRKFGNDPVLVVGDWSAPNAKFQEPTRNKGPLRYLKKNGFSIYIINEYKTSTYCPACKYSEMESFKEITNPRPFQRERFPNVLCHGLLK